MALRPHSPAAGLRDHGPRRHLRALLSQLLFPLPVVTAGLLDDIAAFAAGRHGDPGLTRLLAELGDLGERSLRSRALSSPTGPSQSGMPRL